MKADAKEFDRQYAEAVARGKEGPICGTGPGPYDFGIHDEHGTVIEAEYGAHQRVYIVNICERESSSSMFITRDKEKLRAFRDAITRMLDNT